MKRVIAGVIPQTTTTATAVVIWVPTPLAAQLTCLLKSRHGFSTMTAQCMFPGVHHSINHAHIHGLPLLLIPTSFHSLQKPTTRIPIMELGGMIGLFSRNAFNSGNIFNHSFFCFNSGGVSLSRGGGVLI